MGRDIWHMTESRCIHSPELLLLALLLVLLATGILNNRPGLTSCCCDNIGLVSLILLGWVAIACPIFPFDLLVHSTTVLCDIRQVTYLWGPFSEVLLELQNDI